MGYTGRQAVRSGDIRRFNFTGNGSNTAFDLGFAPATQNQLIVTVNGLVQHYDAFSITGSVLTFTGTPASGDTIQVTAVVDAVGVAAIPDGAIANVSSLAVSGAATFSNTTAHTGAATFSNTVTATGNISTTGQLLANGDIKGITATNPTIWSSNSAALTDGSMYMQFNTSSSEGRLGSYTNHPLVLLTNNTRQVIVDTSGRVTMPYQPALFAQPDGNANIAVGSSPCVYGWNTSGSIRFNRGFTIGAATGSQAKVFNASSTGRITVPAAGAYRFIFDQRCESKSGNAGGTGQAGVWINGTQYIRRHIETWAYTDYTHCIVSGTLNLAANDYLEFGMWWNSGSYMGGGFSGTGDTVNWLSLEKIS